MVVNELDAHHWQIVMMHLLEENEYCEVMYPLVFINMKPCYCCCDRCMVPKGQARLCFG